MRECRHISIIFLNIKSEEELKSDLCYGSHYRTHGPQSVAVISVSAAPSNSALRVTEQSWFVPQSTRFILRSIGAVQPIVFDMDDDHKEDYVGLRDGEGAERAVCQATDFAQSADVFML